MDITENIKNLLAENNIKQEFLASKLGVTQGTLSAKLTRGNQIKFNSLLEISKVTNIPLVDFITYPDKYTPKEKCVDCKRKDEVIDNLNEYINILKSNKA